MGNIRRIKKQIGKPVQLADTGMVFNNCPVLLGVPNGVGGGNLVRKFQIFMGGIVARSKRVNLGDMYAAHLKVAERLRSGESLIERKE